MDWIVLVLTSSVVTAIVNMIWKLIENKKQFADTKYLQISNYYRNRSGEDMHKILNQWTDMLMSNDDPKVKKRMADSVHLKNLIKQTYLYSSPETVRRLANYQAYNYRESEKDDFYEMLVLVTGIIVSLRHDFTGDWVSIGETLKLKLTDYEKNKQGFQEEINKLGYEKS